MARRSLPDLIFLELSGNRVDCVETIRFLRAEPESSHLPVVVVSARDDERGRVEALSVGASEFLVQPADASETTARVRSAMRLASLVRRLGEVEGKMAEVRVVDEESGLLQSGYIEQRMGAEVKSARRHAHPLSIIAMRLDPPGEDVLFDFGPYLRPIAEQVKNLVRDEDLVGRYGPAEVLVVMPHTDSYGSLILAERIREAVESLSGFGPPITTSVGVASCQKADDFLREPLLGRALAAMQRASNQGGNRVVKQE